MKGAVVVSVIAVVGSLNMDMVIRAPRQPRLGETLMGSSFGTTGGGKGANQALACARLGAEAYIIGCVGNDEFGRRLKGTLTEGKVDCSHLNVCSGTVTGVAVITVTDNGENTIVLAPGANFLLDKEAIEKARDILKMSETVMFQLESPLETVIEGLKIGRRMGCKTVLTPSPALNLPGEIWSLIDCLVLNEIELAFYAGVNLNISDPDPERDKKLLEAAQQMVRWGTKKVVLTQGVRGGMVITKNKNFRYEAFKVHSVDSTGAGDSFCAALSVKLSEGAAIEEAVEFASAAGALACTKYGAQPSMPWRHEVEAFLDRAEKCTS